ncbi:hypothetical protein [Aquimarina algicola]|uniref:Uncharacterized protein n=1 Tax=Aquimarina algicola TaxID=2589995 RepID=A0A504IWQ4_9FLAO|nr:hypothetical protein [Aquimarina algicola]TPN82816.1 hypothetical protein FHK87_20530 [Aquimarina algicola]
MTQNRIWFKNNPWPEGHAIKEVKLYGVLKSDRVLLHLSIKSEDYYAKEGWEATREREKTYDDALYDKGIEDNWQMMAGWLNYHSCHIQPNEYHLLGDHKIPFALDTLDSLTIALDNPPPEDKNWGGISFDDLAFHCYVLGHDAVGYHNISFSSAKTDMPYHYDIDWTGKVALAYMGDEEFKYDFKIQLRDVPFVGFDGVRRNELRYRGKGDSKENYWYDKRQDQSLEEREAELRAWIEANTTIPPAQLKFVAEEHSDWLKLI